MTIHLIVFFALALTAVAAAVGMLLSRNAIYAALYLIVNFGVIALFYLLLGAPFISMAQVTVYAGAIMVLFLFVIMLLGTDLMPEGSRLPWQQSLAIVLGVVFLAEAAYVGVTRSGVLPVPESFQPDFGNPTDIGLTLFSRYLLPFEITSILLLVAIVGAIVLSRKRPQKNP